MLILDVISLINQLCALVGFGFIFYLVLRFRGWLWIVLKLAMEIEQLLNQLDTSDASAVILGTCESAPSFRLEGSAPVAGTSCNWKREKLAAVIATGQAEKFLGRTLTLTQIDKLADSELEKLYTRYEMYLGATTAATLGHGIMAMYSNIAARYLPIPYPGQLAAELKSNPIIELELSSGTAQMYRLFGKLLVVATVLVTTLKHVDLNYKTVTDGAEHDDRTTSGSASEQDEKS